MIPSVFAFGQREKMTCMKKYKMINRLFLIIYCICLMGCGVQNNTEKEDTVKEEANNQGENTQISDEIEAEVEYHDGLAYFVSGSKYGFLNEKNEVAFYMDCDSVSDFSEGLAYYSEEGRYGYIDKTGNVVIDAQYQDADFFQNGLAFVMIDGYQGAINKTGEIVIPVQYESLFRIDEYVGAVYRDETEYFDKNGVQYKEIEVQNEFITEELQNHITPKRECFYDLVYFHQTQALGMDGEMTDIEQINFQDDIEQATKIFAKYVNVDDSSNPVLYYKETADEEGRIFPLSSSGIYVFLEGKLYLLVSAYECGGSLRGDYACFYKEDETGKMYLGSIGEAGGFGGHSNYNTVYAYQNGNLETLALYEKNCQMSSNYQEDELLEYAQLFYANDTPLNKENILQTEYITEYRVNDGRIDLDYYNEISKKYRKITLFG